VLRITKFSSVTCTDGRADWFPEMPPMPGQPDPRGPVGQAPAPAPAPAPDDGERDTESTSDTTNNVRSNFPETWIWTEAVTGCVIYVAAAVINCLN